MALNINSNFSAISSGALSAMKTHQSAMGTSITRISTGSRLNSAKDGAASFVSAKKIQTDADGYNALYNNVQNGATSLNVAEKGVSSILDTLRSMRELALDYSNLSSSAQGDDEGSALQNQFSALQSALSSLTSVEYKGDKLLSDAQSFDFETTLDGSVDKKFSAKVGTNALQNENGVVVGSYNSSTSAVSINGTAYYISDTNKLYASGFRVGTYTASSASKLATFTLESSVKKVTYTLNTTSDGKLTNTSLSGVTFKYGGNNAATSVKVGNITFKVSDTGELKSGKIIGGTLSGNTLVINSTETISANSSKYNVKWNAINSFLTSLSINNASEIKSAITKVSQEEAKIGGGLAALDYISASLQNITNAQYEAYEAISDADMATEMTKYVKNNIYAQAAQAMIAQANQSMASVLNLLQ